MESRKVACLVAAGFLSASLTAAAASADAKQSRPLKEVVVEGKRFDPETQRRVSYADLNLASSPDQRTLRGRISSTARGLCSDLGYGFREDWGCRDDAIRSTDDQVALAISRAQDKLAGRAVGPAIAISMVVGAR